MSIYTAFHFHSLFRLISSVPIKVLGQGIHDGVFPSFLLYFWLVLVILRLTSTLAEDDYRSSMLSLAYRTCPRMRRIVQKSLFLFSRRSDAIWDGLAYSPLSYRCLFYVNLSTWNDVAYKEFLSGYYLSSFQSFQQYPWVILCLYLSLSLSFIENYGQFQRFVHSWFRMVNKFSQV